MEIRGQARGLGMPNSMGYNLPQLNRESATKLPSASIASTVPAERNDPGNSTIISPNQTLDRHNLTQHQHHQHHDHHHQQQDGHRDGSPDADPAPAPALVTSPSSSKTVPSPSSQPTPQPTASVSTSIRYRECLKNHAANMGGHVLDGCGEFMPSGEEGTPEALKCAACDCHRNFHRKEIEGEQQKGTSYHSTYHLTRANNIPHRTTRHHTHPPISTMPPQHQQQQHKHKYPPMAPMMMAFGGNSESPAEYSSSEDLNMFHSNTGPHAVLQPSYSMSKKRFRTKFTQQQKDKMHEFAERLGWRIQKQDEQEVQQFCDEVGVKRQVFKVWMHNNKQATKKKHM